MGNEVGCFSPLRVFLSRHPSVNIFVCFFFVGSEAKKLFDDAEGMLKKVMETKSLWATGVVAFFPSNSVGDDIHVFEDDNERKGSPKAVFYGLRQQVGKAIKA